MARNGQIDLGTPVWQLTIGELVGVLTELLPAKEDKRARAEKRLVHGIDGIAELFNCSRSTAQHIKNSGVIDKAISQYGRTITVDADLAVSLMSGKGGQK